MSPFIKMLLYFSKEILYILDFPLKDIPEMSVFALFLSSYSFGGLIKDNK
jgi:hypothetical protein